MDVKFGTSGLRGLSKDLDGEVSARYVAGFCRYLKESGMAAIGDEVLVGRDLRASSPSIARICFAAIENEGMVPIDCGVVPTPALAFYGMIRAAACVMVTGSHIPEDRNGIKFYRPGSAGEITKEDEVAIGMAASGIEFEAEWGDAASDEGECARMFMERIDGILAADALSGMRVGVYEHSSVARDMLVKVLEGAGAEVIRFGRSETFVPVDTEAVTWEVREIAAEAAKKYGLDTVVSTDGDADRPLVMDAKGVPARGDALGILTAAFCGADVVVTPVTSNSGLERSGDWSVVRTAVGSPYVIEGMETPVREGKMVVGFEANGGFLVGSPVDLSPGGTVLSRLATRDCFLPILAVLGMANALGRDVGRLVDDLGLPFAKSDRIRDYDRDRSSSLSEYLWKEENVRDFFRNVGHVVSASYGDGVKAFLAGGQTIHFRPSGNAPEMRCYVEAGTEEGAEALLREGLSLLEAWEG